MKKLIVKTFILLSLGFIAFDTNAAKIGQFFVKNPDGAIVYITPDEAKEKSRKGEKVYFQKHGSRARIITKNSTLFPPD
ncbi:MAG: hypothetical protein Q8L85_03035 [Alphaproteobacteria bacterium]|nr:hypothetical protein [Alphaproteobacteria bacterium]MDP3531808.1 hypothetical protein [Alphaproteobacteria bacterium]